MYSQSRGRDVEINSCCLTVGGIKYLTKTKRFGAALQPCILHKAVVNVVFSSRMCSIRGKYGEVVTKKLHNTTWDFRGFYRIRLSFNQLISLL